MLNEKLTFNDLPEVVGKLCERIESLENALKDNLAKQAPAKENLHVPMTVEEVCSYLGISKSSFYYKAKQGGIPVIKQGKHLFVYRDELDKWLESSRKNPVPLSDEELSESLYSSHRRKPAPRNW